MMTREVYKQEIEAEIKLAQAKIVELKADDKNYMPDMRDKYSKHIDEIQYMLDNTHDKLSELGKASDDLWESLKDGVESSWKALDSAINEAANKFKHEHIKHNSKAHIL
jgi:ElaB/YqjD/DUF883 family membrane-anchored ribosome-binding protein